MPYEPPENVDELTSDLESHPDRGKINGQDVVRFDLKEFSGLVPYALAKRALECGAPYGFTRDEILTAALTMWTSDAGVQQARLTYQQELAEKHQTSTRRIRSKIHGAYKKVRRVRQLNALNALNAQNAPDIG